MTTDISSSLVDLQGRTALVTGGSRGVGRDIATRLAEAGADVMFTYRSRADAAEEVVASIHALGRRAVAVQADLTGTGDVARLAAEVSATLEGWDAPGLDVLVHNAGVGSHQAVGSVTEAEVDRVFATNYKSVVFLTEALLPTLREGGSIVAIGTGLTRFSLAGMGIYGSLKAALERYMAYLAVELGPRGIRANAVAPGALDTDFNAAALEANPGMRPFIEGVTALGRMGVAEDIGAVVAMLASPAGRWITGQRIEASGGMFL